MTALRGVSGGISSAIAGGSFWDGMKQGLIVSLFNEAAHYGQKLLTKGAFQKGTDQNGGKGSTEISEQGIEFIKSYEGLYLDQYTDIAGYKTIGYGHKIEKGEDFSKGITKDEALSLLKKDIEIKAASYVRKFVTVPLSQNQFDALASFAFNVGGTAFKNSSLLGYVNEGNTKMITQGLTSYGNARVDGRLTLVRGLCNRRIAEANMYYSGMYNNN